MNMAFLTVPTCSSNSHSPSPQLSPPVQANMGSCWAHWCMRFAWGSLFSTSFSLLQSCMSFQSHCTCAPHLGCYYDELKADSKTTPPDLTPRNNSFVKNSSCFFTPWNSYVRCNSYGNESLSKARSQ